MRHTPTNIGFAGVIPLGISLTLLLCSCGKDSPESKSENKNPNAAQPTPLPEASLDPVTPEDQLDLGYKYLLGEEIAADHKKAAKLFRKAAENGNSNAQFALGCLYQNGQGVEINYREAVKWYLKAAQAGNAYGQFLMGLSLKDGSGVPKDPTESFKWIHLAAEQKVEAEHIEVRDQLLLILTPSMIEEAKRRADQFLLYQGVGSN